MGGSARRISGKTGNTSEKEYFTPQPISRPMASCRRLFSLFLSTLAFAGVSAQAQDTSPSGAFAPNTLVEINPPAFPADTSPLAITNARLIDGRGGEPIEDAVVIVQNGRIRAAGPAEEMDISEGAEIYDAGGQTLMPGLIDAHFHSTNDNELLALFLSNGVTTLREPGHPFRFYQSVFFAEEPLPRVYMTGGHFDGFPPVHKTQAVVIRDAEHARQMVTEHVQQGATGIKIYFRLPEAYYETVTQAAGQYGIPVLAHLELVDADDAIRAGVMGIEHVTSFGTALAGPEEAERFKAAVRANNMARGHERYQLWSTIDLDHPRVKEVLDLARRANIFFSPNLAVFELQEGGEGVEDYHLQGFAKMMRFVGMAREAGLQIVTGSHTNVPYAERGKAYQREMELLVEAGLSPMEVIRSSTFVNARYFGAESRIGSIEPGKLADLVLIDGDPLADIRQMYRVQRVMLNGQWVERYE